MEADIDSAVDAEATLAEKLEQRLYRHIQVGSCHRDAGMTEQETMR